MGYERMIKMTITKNVWKAAAFLLILCLVSTVMISGTYAKYTSEFSGQDTALVAKWNIIATGGSIGLTEGGMADLDLFNHNLTNIATASGGAYFIAPGAHGQFTLSFQNNSDVNARISFSAINVTGTAVGVPIKYSIDGGTTSMSAVDLQTALNTTPGFLSIANNASVTQNVLWDWPYFVNTDGDAADTLIGTTSAITAGRTTYRLEITASAIQLAPTTP